MYMHLLCSVFSRACFEERPETDSAADVGYIYFCEVKTDGGST